MRSLHRQSRPPRDRACPRGETVAVLAAQSGRLSEEAAFSRTAPAPSPHADRDRRVPREHRPRLAALRTTDDPLRHPRLLPARRIARAAAAARCFYLEPAARPRLAARPVEGAHSP